MRHVIILNMILSQDVVQYGNANFIQIIAVNECLFVVLVKERRSVFVYSMLSIVLILLEGEANVRVGTSYDNKTDQWLGASLAANDGYVIVNYDFYCLKLINTLVFLLRQVHHFLNIVLTMETISNTKYQVVHSLENMVHLYQ